MVPVSLIRRAPVPTVVMWLVIGCAGPPGDPPLYEDTDEDPRGDTSADTDAPMGCSDREPTCGVEHALPSDSSQPWLRIGTGFRAFTEVTESGPIDIYEGVQGGHHVFVSLAGDGFDGTGAFLQARVCRATETVADLQAIAQFEPTEAGQEMIGLPLIFQTGFDGPSLHEEALTLSVELELASGVVLEDEVQVVGTCCLF